MSVLVGHYFLGTHFIVLGLWWIYSAWLRYFLCCQRKRSYHVTFSFPLMSFGSSIARLPLDPLFLLIATTIGLAIETQDESFISFSPVNQYHLLMYSMFFLLAIVELLAHSVVWLPKDFEILFGLFTFAIEGYFLHSHEQRDSLLETSSYQWILISIIGTTLASIFELIQYEKHVFSTIMRGYFTILQGLCFFINSIWFMLLGFVIVVFFAWLAHRNSQQYTYYFLCEEEIEREKTTDSICSSIL